MICEFLEVAFKEEGVCICGSSATQEGGDNEKEFLRNFRMERVFQGM